MITSSDDEDFNCSGLLTARIGCKADTKVTISQGQRGMPARAPRRSRNRETDFSDLKNVLDYVLDVRAEFIERGSLGQGSFGTVWKGQSRITGWTVAVKEILTERLEGKDLDFYTREIRILVQCKNPFLLDFIGFTLTPPYSIVTTFMPCGSLWDAIHNKLFLFRRRRRQ
jgi:serine/threonine protein kinase